MNTSFLDSEVKRINNEYKYYKNLKIIIPKKTIAIADPGFEGDINLNELVERRNLMCVDVETSRYGKLIQVAYNIYNSEFKIIKSYDTLIDDGVNEVDFFEKYTIDEIMLCGVSSREAFAIIKKDIDKCSHVVGHNISYDMRKLDEYFEKLRIPYNKPERICTMRTSVNFCKLPSKGKVHKVPKLSELYKVCFNKEPDNTKTHTANYDIEITWDCFKHLYEKKIIKL